MPIEVIPFEIHITVNKLSNDREHAFVDYCHAHNSKPLLIELAQGEHMQQPMLSKVVYTGSTAEAVKLANAETQQMADAGYVIRRIKIEIPAIDAHLLANELFAYERYYEWHGKVDYIYKDELIQLCMEHKAHLSTNALKYATDKRFVTLREYGNIGEFHKRIAALRQSLNKGGWTFSKQQAEYCVYDNNVQIDKGWLPMQL